MSARFLLSCGEASGDLYAGALARELRALAPDADVFGLGGPQFAAAGGRRVADYRELSVNGLFEVIGKIPQLAAARKLILKSAEAAPPDVFVPIDFWGFNYRLAQAMAKRTCCFGGFPRSEWTCGRKSRWWPDAGLFPANGKWW